MILESEAKIKRGWKPPLELYAEALQKLGSPERLNPKYILLKAELDKWNANSFFF